MLNDKIIILKHNAVSHLNMSIASFKCTTQRTCLMHIYASFEVFLEFDN